MALLVTAAKATRGKARAYELKTTWPSHAEGELYLSNINLLENPWSRGNLDISVGGDRTRKLKCPYPGCKAKANIKFLSGDIAEYWECGAHIHDPALKKEARGIAPDVKTRIDELQALTQKSSGKAVLEAFLTDNEQKKTAGGEFVDLTNVPSRRQLTNYLATKKRSAGHDNGPTAADFDDLFRRRNRLSVGGDPDKPFFLAIETTETTIDGSDATGLTVRLAISTLRLLSLPFAHAFRCLNMDGTYKLTAEGIPFIVIGFDDINRHHHIWGLGASSTETAASYEWFVRVFMDHAAPLERGILTTYLPTRSRPVLPREEQWQAEAGMSDAAAAIFNGMSAGMPKMQNKLTCFAHCYVKVKGYVKGMPEAHAQRFLNGVNLIANAWSRPVFERFRDLFFTYWTALEATVSRIHAALESLRFWFESGRDGWGACAMENQPRANQGQESKNKVIKAEMVDISEQPKRLLVVLDSTLGYVARQSFYLRPGHSNSVSVVLGYPTDIEPKVYKAAHNGVLKATQSGSSSGDAFITVSYVECLTTGVVMECFITMTHTEHNTQANRHAAALLFASGNFTSFAQVEGFYAHCAIVTMCRRQQRFVCTCAKFAKAFFCKHSITMEHYSGGPRPIPQEFCRATVLKTRGVRGAPPKQENVGRYAHQPPGFFAQAAVQHDELAVDGCSDADSDEDAGAPFVAADADPAGTHIIYRSVKNAAVLLAAQAKVEAAGAGVDLRAIKKVAEAYSWLRLQTRTGLTDKELMQLKRQHRVDTNAAEDAAASASGSSSVSVSLPPPPLPLPVVAVEHQDTDLAVPSPPRGLPPPQDSQAAVEVAVAVAAAAVDAVAEDVPGSDLPQLAALGLGAAAAPTVSSSPTRAAKPKAAGKAPAKRVAESTDHFLAPPSPGRNDISRPAAKKRAPAAPPPALEPLYSPPTRLGRTDRNASPPVGGVVELAYTQTVNDLGLRGWRGRVVASELRTITVEVHVDRGAGVIVEHHVLRHKDVYHVDVSK